MVLKSGPLIPFLPIYIYKFKIKIKIFNFIIFLEGLSKIQTGALLLNSYDLCGRKLKIRVIGQIEKSTPGLVSLHLPIP